MQMPVLAPDTPSERMNGMDWICIILLEFDFRGTLWPKRKKFERTGLPVICVYQNKICETLLAHGDYGTKSMVYASTQSQLSMCCVYRPCMYVLCMDLMSHISLSLSFSHIMYAYYSHTHIYKMCMGEAIKR
jgi:hypothetical protein